MVDIYSAMNWTLPYWILTVMMSMLFGWVYSDTISRLLVNKYVRITAFIIFGMICIVGVYGYFIGDKVRYFEFNMDRNDTTLMTCFEHPPVIKVEHKYDCGETECTILHYNKFPSEGNQNKSLSISSISWEP